jgi:RNA polymerase sigma factor (sigma-70 family)
MSVETHPAPDPTGSVTQHIQRFRSGDPGHRDEAARQLWERYFPRLLILARRQLDRRIRIREDEEDVALSAGKSVFKRLERGDFDLAGRDDLWALLARVVRNKACNAADRQLCDKRDVRRTRAFVPSDVDQSDAPRRGPGPVEDPEPTPEEVAVATELCEELERRLESLDPKDPLMKQVALLKMDEYTNSEIAKRLECSDRTVERKLNRVRKRWQATVEDSA